MIRKYDEHVKYVRVRRRLPKREAHSSGLQHGKQNVTAVEKNQFSILVFSYFSNV